MKASEVIKEATAAGRHQQGPPPPGESEIRDAERPVIDELQSLGVDTRGVHQLSGKIDKHPGARAVVFEHLERDHSEYVRSRMAAALAGPSMTNEEFQRLVTAYRSEASSRMQDQFASAVARSARGRLDDVIELIGDRSLGKSRVLLVEVVARSKKSEARETLESLRDDRDLEVEIGRRRSR